MYRRNPARQGTTTSSVAADVTTLWQARLGGRLTQPVVADGRLLVAATDAGTIHALDAPPVEPLWRTAGGRIDSALDHPPGLVLFGSADGWVYCLRAVDGAMTWHRAAPQERRIVAFGQLESVWPVHGSVLVHHGVAYFTAGRSTHLDGGIHAYGVQPQTGKLLHYACLEGAALPEQPAAEGEVGRRECGRRAGIRAGISRRGGGCRPVGLRRPVSLSRPSEARRPIGPAADALRNSRARHDHRRWI